MSLIWLYLPPTMPVSSEYWCINVCGRDSAFTFKIVEIIKLLLIQRVLRISSEKPLCNMWSESEIAISAPWLQTGLWLACRHSPDGCMAAVSAYNLAQSSGVSVDQDCIQSFYTLSFCFPALISGQTTTAIKGWFWISLYNSSYIGSSLLWK